MLKLRSYNKINLSNHRFFHQGQPQSLQFDIFFCRTFQSPKIRFSHIVLNFDFFWPGRRPLCGVVWGGDSPPRCFLNIVVNHSPPWQKQKLEKCYEMGSSASKIDLCTTNKHALYTKIMFFMSIRFGRNITFHRFLKIFEHNEKNTS